MINDSGSLGGSLDMPAESKNRLIFLLYDFHPIVRIARRRVPRDHDQAHSNRGINDRLTLAWRAYVGRFKTTAGLRHIRPISTETDTLIACQETPLSLMLSHEYLLVLSCSSRPEAPSLDSWRRSDTGIARSLRARVLAEMNKASKPSTSTSSSRR